MNPDPFRTLAEQADRHVLYQQSVQDVEAEIDFVAETWATLRDRPARLLREDFCGTANTSCEWVRRDPAHRALGVDRDTAVLAWGRAHNIAQMDVAQRQRIELLQDDVRAPHGDPADIVLAMNFSYFIFANRPQMLEYFRAVRAGLADDGVLFLDAYGGYDAPRVLEETRDCDGFTYIWDQHSFNPIDSMMQCYIHFEFPDGSRMDQAFSYYWRLWTLPELTEMLLEAGFSSAVVYWEGTDPETGEGDGIYTPATVGDADAGWICYIVAEA